MSNTLESRELQEAEEYRRLAAKAKAAASSVAVGADPLAEFLPVKRLVVLGEREQEIDPGSLLPKSSLLEMKRKFGEELADHRENTDAGYKRVKIIQYTSEDAEAIREGLKKPEPELLQHYCAVKLPRRTMDKAACLEESSTFFKQYLKASFDKTLIERGGKGVEVQYRLSCQECGIVVAYRSAPLGEASPYLYVHPNTLVTQKAEALRFRKKGIII